MFLNRYENYVLADPKSGPVRLLFVVFYSEEGKSQFKDEAVLVVDEFKKRNPAAKIDYIFVKGEFSRAIGLDTGVKHVRVLSYYLVQILMNNKIVVRRFIRF